MNPVPFSLRRATAEDLPKLTELWREAKIPTNELEKHFTEFQVAESPDQQLLGAIALRISGKDGFVHSESFGDFALADQLRPKFWERLQSMSQNHGLYRLWTVEDAPYWKQSGFGPIPADHREKVPGTFGIAPDKGLLLVLKDESAIIRSIDKEFEAFRLAERERTDRVLSQAKTLKNLGLLIAIGLLLFVLGAGFYLLRGRLMGGP
jgi:N-acetylglutamate synthase-like GNAT family acetyltransferase